MSVQLIQILLRLYSNTYKLIQGKLLIFEQIKQKYKNGVRSLYPLIYPNLTIQINFVSDRKKNEPQATDL